MKLFYRDIEDVVDEIRQAVYILNKTTNDIYKDGLTKDAIIDDIDYALDILEYALKLMREV